MAEQQSGGNWTGGRRAAAGVATLAVAGGGGGAAFRALQHETPMFETVAATLEHQGMNESTIQRVARSLREFNQQYGSHVQISLDDVQCASAMYAFDAADDDDLAARSSASMDAQTNCGSAVLGHLTNLD